MLNPRVLWAAVALVDSGAQIPHPSVFSMPMTAGEQHEQRARKWFLGMYRTKEEKGTCREIRRGGGEERNVREPSVDMIKC